MTDIQTILSDIKADTGIIKNELEHIKKYHEELKTDFIKHKEEADCPGGIREQVWKNSSFRKNLMKHIGVLYGIVTAIIISVVTKWI